MAVEKDMIELAIGALLHDIGKIAERTGKKLAADNLHLFRYSHAAYTSSFFDTVQGIWDKLDASRVGNIASYHHNPGSAEQRIIQQADIYSAASERVEKQKDMEVQLGRSRRPLVSVFPSIRLSGDGVCDTAWAHPVAAWLPDTGAVFPTEHTPGDNLVNEHGYQDLVRDMYEDFSKLGTCPVNLLIDSVIHICRRYMSLVTSSATRQEVPDIPLFDHSYTTAAIACAMYAWHKENNTLAMDSVSNLQDPRLMLASGDLSGIQDFILDLPNEKQAGTAKRLRARSFYVTMLTWVASRLLLDDLGLPSCNCLMDAGGRFVILAHNTTQARTALEGFRKRSDQWMLSTFQGRLVLNISEPVTVCGDDFMHGRYRRCIEALGANTDIAKKRKLASCLQHDGQWDEEAFVRPCTDADDSLDAQMKDLGGRLAGANYVLLEDDDSQTDAMRLFDRLSLRVDARLPGLHGHVAAALALNPKACVPGFAGRSITCHVPRLETDIVQDGEELKKGQVMHFSRIAEASAGAYLLGVLKADVDRLGQLFAQGIRDEHYSISRVAAFSRQVDSFFSGCIQSMLSADYKYIYTEYAGGDDLLLIGPWNRIMSLAADINRKFHDYTCHNPDITLSASIVLTHAGKPISNAIRRASDLLDRAKTEGRNRVGILDMTLPWSEYSKALDDAGFLTRSLQNGEINSGFIYRLLRYYQMYSSARDGNLRDMLWRSQLKYDMGRNLKKDASETRRRIEQITVLSNMPRLKVSSTYALYENRNK